MTLSSNQVNEISLLLLSKLREKLSRYDPETQNMPFHTRLLGKDRMAVFSFVQSINTSLGTSIFEQIGAVIARPNFRRVEHQYSGLGQQISEQSLIVIQRILNELETASTKPNKDQEIKLIFEVSSNPPLVTKKPTRVDFFVESNDGAEYYFDIKTAKPNIGDFKQYKRNLLEWIALRGTVASPSDIHTLIAIPYNPYEPAPYQRWTLQGLYDLKKEVLVADEFWDFLGGNGTYLELLDLFEKVGMTLRPEIDSRFSQL
jgi:type II restriction enzyme